MYSRHVFERAVGGTIVALFGVQHRRYDRLRRMIYFSLVFAVAPFVMALIRPNQSGDLRMLWMVLAAFTATVVVVATAKSQKSAGNTIVPIVAFTLATFAATITRMAFG